VSTKIHERAESESGDPERGTERRAMTSDGPEVVVEREEGGVAVLFFDSPGKKVNTLSSKSMAELESQLRVLSQDDTVQALVLASRKPGCFVAGAEIGEIRDIVDPGRGAEMAAKGQAVFSLLEDLPFPTVAAIHGVCLGGGAELALACKLRVAGEGDSFKMGFPEVNLGILPAFGGTYRLPRLIGLVQSLDLLLGGKTVDARKALRMGFVDRVAPERGLLAAALEVARKAARDPKKIPRLPRFRARGMQRFLDGTAIGRSLVLSTARKKVLSKTHGHYPAPLAILDVLPRLLRLPREKGMALEAETLGRLVVTDVSKSLIGIFFLNEEAKKVGAKGASSHLSRVGVIGAGVMGAGIASLFVRRGLTVRLVDVAAEAMGRGLAAIRSEIEARVKRRSMKRFEAEAALARTAPSTRLSDMACAPFVVEAAVESLEIKRKLVKDLGSFRKEPLIFATNTSSIPLSEIAEGAPSHVTVVGMHFFNPVERMPLVEVMEAGATRIEGNEPGEAAQIVLDLARRMGKVPILVADRPGFLVNRILSPYLSEAVRLVCEGASIENVDRLMTDFGMPMGPLRLLDEVGLDVARHVSSVLDKGAQNPFKRLIEALVEKKRTGKKSGRGFYVHGKGKKKPEPDAELRALVASLFGLADGTTGPDDDEITSRLLLSLVNEAARCLEEGIVRTPGELDLAMILGTGFPPFRGGLLRHADTVGLRSVADGLRALEARYGERFRPCPFLGTLASDGKTFFGHSR